MTTPCHRCRTLDGLIVGLRGQTQPCDCPNGDKWRKRIANQNETDRMLGLVPAGQSEVMPHQRNNRTMLIG